MQRSKHGAAVVEVGPESWNPSDRNPVTSKPAESMQLFLPRDEELPEAGAGFLCLPTSPPHRTHY